VAARGPQLAVLYDGECGFCVWALAWLLRWDRARRLEPIAIQSEKGQRLLADMAPELRLESWHLRQEQGCLRSGGQALSDVLGRLPLGRPLAALTARYPQATERAYAWVASHRSALGRLLTDASKRRARALIAARML
jgi:predicted DCC family thiol-disulfide oxidoreductase YuxK